MNIYSIGKERLYLAASLVVAILAITFAGVSYYRQNSKVLQAQTDLKNSEIKYKVIEGKLVQAENSHVLDTEELKKTLSKNFQDQLDTQKQQILATIKANIAIWAKGEGTGTGTPTGDPTKPITEFRFHDDLMTSIVVDAKVPTKPYFTYEIAPFNIAIEASLNFDAREGVTKFWAQPSSTHLPNGLNVSIPRIELNPSAEFNRWVTDLRGSKTTVAVPAKYTLNALLGKDFSPGLYSPKLVYGVQLQYNWINGLGAGVGIIGNTTFVSGGYSWGKH